MAACFYDCSIIPSHLSMKSYCFPVAAFPLILRDEFLVNVQTVLTCAFFPLLPVSQLQVPGDLSQTSEDQSLSDFEM